MVLFVSRMGNILSVFRGLDVPILPAPTGFIAAILSSLLLPEGVIVTEESRLCTDAREGVMAVSRLCMDAREGTLVKELRRFGILGDSDEDTATFGIGETSLSQFFICSGLSRFTGKEPSPALDTGAFVRV